jgi:hypothetical protein
VIRHPTVHGHPEGKVEVAVEEPAVPSHTDLMTTHETIEGVRVEAVPEKLSVGLFLTPALSF